MQDAPPRRVRVRVRRAEHSPFSSGREDLKPQKQACYVGKEQLPTLV